MNGFFIISTLIALALSSFVYLRHNKAFKAKMGEVGIELPNPDEANQKAQEAIRKVQEREQLQREEIGE